MREGREGFFTVANTCSVPYFYHFHSYTIQNLEYMYRYRFGVVQMDSRCILNYVHGSDLELVYSRMMLKDVGRNL